MGTSSANNPSRFGPASLAGGALGLFWLLFWSAITMAFNGLWLWMIATQVETWSYAATDGTVLESRIEQGEDSDGHATYDAKIAYEYTVSGQKYRGDTSGPMSFRMGNGRNEARAKVARFPVGKVVPVYYAADRPEKSVLDRQLRGRDFFLPLFMTPFNIVMVTGWCGWMGSWRKNARPAGIRVRDDGLKVTARLYNVTPGAAAVGGLMASSFVMIFVCGFGMMAAPVDWLVTGGWCIVLGSTMAAWVWCRQPATTLEYDQFAGRITVTSFDGSSHAFTTGDVIAVGRAPVVEEEDEEEEEPDEDDEEMPAFPEDDEPAGDVVCYPTITYRDAVGSEQTVTLVNWGASDASQWLVRWLKETLRVKE